MRMQFAIESSRTESSEELKAMARDAAERMLGIKECMMSVQDTVSLASRTHVMTSPDWSIEDLEHRVTSCDQLLRQPQWGTLASSSNTQAWLTTDHEGR